MKIKKTVELQYKDLQACSLFKASNDVRFYLCGVYVGDGAVVATNGHTMLICDDPNAADLDLIIPKETIDSLLRKVGKRPKFTTVQLHQLEDGFWLLEHIGSYELFKPVDSKYPAWRRVDMKKPKKYTAESFPQFNFDYLNDFKKVAHIYSGNTVAQPKLFPTTANDRCYVEINDRVHGVIMPLRT